MLVDLLVNNKLATFKLDCRADVTLISQMDYAKVANGKKLRKSDKVLIGANSQPLNVIGVFNCTTVSKDRGSKNKKCTFWLN